MKTTTHTFSKDYVVTIDTTRTGSVVSVDYLVSKFTGTTYEFAGGITLGLTTDPKKSDEEDAHNYYKNVLEVVFMSGSLPNKPAVLDKDKRLALAKAHVLEHRKMNPLKGKMNQTKAEHKLVKSFGISSAVPFLSELDDLPFTTIRRRLFGQGKK